MTTRVLVADDHTLFRKGVLALLATMADVEIVGETSDGQEALALVDSLQPDLVLMDLEMPGGGGLDATRALSETHPEVKVLIVTMNGNIESIRAALRAGACGYVVKDSAPEDLIRAVEAAAHGDTVLTGEAGRSLRNLLAEPSEQPFPELSPSERLVLAAMARGASNHEIGKELFLAEKTVRNYVSNVFAKIGVTDRAQAIVRAREAGLHLQ